MITILTCLFAHGQPHLRIAEENPNLPFDQIVQKVEAFYQGRDKGRGTGYKQFKRWEFFNQHRLDEKGYLQNVSRRLMNEFFEYRSLKMLAAQNFSCEWETVGANAYERFPDGRNGGLGRINTIVVDPDDSDIIYVGTPAGGLWRTTTGGGWNPGSPNTSYWEPLTDGLPIIGVSGVAIDPTSPVGNRTIYILTGDGDGGDTQSIGVLKSFDNGQTWFETDLSFGPNSGVRGYELLMDPADPQTLYVASNVGIRRTTDGGLNWATVQGGSFFDIEFRPGTPDTMYAASRTQFWRSIDGGLNWNPLTTAGCTFPTAPTVERGAIAVTPDDPDYVYYLAGGVPHDGMGNNVSGQHHGIFRSTDSGDCFTLMSNTPNILDGSQTGNGDREQASYDLTIAVSPTDREEVHVGGINIFRSPDGGATWTNTAHWEEHVVAANEYTHADIHFLDFIGNRLYCGSDGLITYSTNAGDDWVNISQGLQITQYYRIAAFTSSSGSDWAMGGAQDNGLNHLEDSGSGFGLLQHWEGADGFEVSPDIADDRVFGATQNGCINRYDFPGGAFTYLTVFPGDSCGGAWLTPHFYDAVNDEVWAGFQDVWMSNDDGNNWSNISGGQVGMGTLAAHMAMAPSNTDYIYVSKDNSTLYRTTDGGTSWDNITDGLSLAQGSISYFTIDPADEDRVWVSISGFFSGSKVWFRDLSDPMGDWQNITGSLPNIPANTIVYEAGSDDGLYVGMDVGVYYRDNDLGDWILFSNGLPNVIVTELDINYSTGKVYAGTFGRGIWCSDLISNCSGICLICPHYDNFHSQPNTYSSEECITSTATVWNATDIVYEAEEYIHLQEDFHVKSTQGASFYGQIETCTGGASLRSVTLSNLRKLRGFYVGKLPDLEVEERKRAQVQMLPVDLYAFPNPTKGELTVRMNLEQNGPTQLFLYDMMGKPVRILEQSSDMQAGESLRTYDLSDLPNGTYILQLVNDGRQSQQAVIKTDR